MTRSKIAFLLGVCCLFGQAPYADKSDLLYYVDAKGGRHTVGSRADWQQRRNHILAAMQEVMGQLPPRSAVPLDMQVVEETNEPEFDLRP